MATVSKGNGRVEGAGAEAWEGSARTLPSAVAAGAYAPVGRISAAAKALGSSATPVPVVPWARDGTCAVDVLVAWAFGPQRVDASPVAGLYAVEAVAAGYAWQHGSSDGCARVAEIGAVGCRVDVSGPGRDMSHPVAELVALEVGRHPDAELLRDWGRLGVAPGGWKVPPRCYMPEAVDAAGDAVWVYRERRSGAHCPVVAVTSPELIQRARDAYVTWWDALCDLQWSLSTRALGFVLLPEPSVPREPWAVGLDRTH